VVDDQRGVDHPPALPAASTDAIDVIEREMSALPNDIARGLEVAFPGRVEGGPMVFHVRPPTPNRIDSPATERASAGKPSLAPAGSMQLEMTPGPERVIALLRLPTLRLRIQFTAGDEATNRQMLARFDLAMRRGGG
jgi:hypothetical protein